MQYQLDDPGEFVDEHIVVVGGGDAGIENALGLAADPEQRNTVTILNRGTDFARASESSAADGDRDNGRINVLTDTIFVAAVELVLRQSTRAGTAPKSSNATGSSLEWARPLRAPSWRVAASSSVATTGRLSKLSPNFESSTPGIYVIGGARGLSAHQALHEPGL